MKKAIEVQQEHVAELVRLMQDNPQLRVVPMVDSNVIASDDFAYWAGSFGEPRLDECFSRDERIYFKSIDEDDLLDEEKDRLDELDQYGHEEIQELAYDNFNKLGWEKVIVVDIKAQ